MVRAQDIGELTVVDGFTIRDGNATGASGSVSGCYSQTAKGGGGMDIVNCGDSLLVVRRCRFESNTAGFGGGVRILCSDPIISECVFLNNAAEAVTGSPGSGGGMYCLASSPEVLNCRFEGNTADHIGGGVAFQAPGGSTPPITAPNFTNCAFLYNLADDWGGGVRCGFRSGCWFTNCTFLGNTSCSGGGFSISWDEEGNVGARSASLTNCIFWDNSFISGSGCGGTQISLGGADIGQGQVPQPLYVSTCDVQGGLTAVLIEPTYQGALSWAASNFDQDPLLTVTADDVLVAFESPCVNAGDGSSLPPDILDYDGDDDLDEPVPYDVNGGSRLAFNGCLDVGASESSVDATCPGDIAGGAGGLPDQVVDGADFAAVLGAWGAPGGVADVTNATQANACGDNVVDAYDLGLVLGAWGPCSGLLMGGGGTTPAELVEEMGFGSIQELAEWLADLGPEPAKAWLELMLG